MNRAMKSKMRGSIDPYGLGFLIMLIGYVIVDPEGRQAESISEPTEINRSVTSVDVAWEEDLDDE